MFMYVKFDIEETETPVLLLEEPFNDNNNTFKIYILKCPYFPLLFVPANV